MKFGLINMSITEMRASMCPSDKQVPILCWELNAVLLGNFVRKVLGCITVMKINSDNSVSVRTAES